MERGGRAVEVDRQELTELVRDYDEARQDVLDLERDILQTVRGQDPIATVGTANGVQLVSYEIAVKPNINARRVKDQRPDLYDALREAGLVQKVKERQLRIDRSALGLPPSTLAGRAAS